MRFLFYGTFFPHGKRFRELVNRRVGQIAEAQGITYAQAFALWYAGACLTSTQRIAL
jgi:hypothetical protein